MKNFLKILAFICSMAFLSVDCYGVNAFLGQSFNVTECSLVDKCGIQNEDVLFLINKAQQDLSIKDFEALKKYIERVKSSNNSYLMFFKKQDNITAMLFIDCENNPVELTYFYKNPMLSAQDSREMSNATIGILRHSGRIQ